MGFKEGPRPALQISAYGKPRNSCKDLFRERSAERGCVLPVHAAGREGLVTDLG